MATGDLSRHKDHTKMVIEIRGKVQGVGFRPAVYRLAGRLQICGYVQNEGGGVTIAASGLSEAVETFCSEVRRIELPGCEITGFEVTEQEKISETDADRLKTQSERPFTIQNSRNKTANGVFFTVNDRSLCEECAAETFTAPDSSQKTSSKNRGRNSRRRGYFFNSCAHCGPRYTLIKASPFDRENTTMHEFPLCPDCRSEYEHPEERRFHAQTISCPLCGPVFELHRQDQTLFGDAALQELVRLIRLGEVAAVKGTGGFHLLCDARCDEAVSEIRKIKQRPEKPFGVLYPSLASVEKEFTLSKAEKEALTSAEKPLVLLFPSQRNHLSFEVSRGFEKTGVFLPDSALYLCLLSALGFPVVATSLNLSGEPLITDFSETKAIKKIAVATHSRRIENRCDDSVLSFAGASSAAKIPIPIRLGKGFAPAVFNLSGPVSKAVLALGGAQKVTITLARRQEALTGPHQGDISSEASQQAFENDCRRLMSYCNFKPELVVCDANRSYFTHQWARSFAAENGIECKSIYHHHAHALSLMAEHGFGPGETLFTAVWDGAGLGPDGHIWGGEFLEAGYDHFERRFHFRPFYLAGGIHAPKFPHKTAASILFDLFGEKAFGRCPHVWKALEATPVMKGSNHELLYAAWQKKINMPKTSSAGRLFDAAASMLHLCHTNTFEGEAAMRLEDCADMSFTGFMKLPVQSGVVEWSPLFQELLSFSDASRAAAFFINSLARVLIHCARDFKRLGLSGGVFQNAKLLAKSIEFAEKENIRLILHRRIPCNDGGLSLGQAIAHDSTLVADLKI